MGFVAQEFPVTPPPNAPLRRDREKMAAINDRYDRVRQVLKTNAAALTLNRGDALVWEPGPGRTVTFPLWVFGVSRLGIPPEVNVLGTLVFVVALIFIGVQIWSQRAGARPTEGAPPITIASR